jgi:four helix bundle protein
MADRNVERSMDADGLSERILDVAVRIGAVVDSLPETRLGRHVAGQLVRSGTAPLPHYAEARAAESRRDFTHKMSIALKELRESHAWLQLIVRARLLPEERMAGIVDECLQLVHIFAASVATAKRNVAKEHGDRPSTKSSSIPTPQSPVPNPQ